MEQQTFPSFNVVNRKSSPYGNKGILRHNHYRAYPKLGSGIVAIRRIPYSCHACTNILSLSWNSKIKEAFNHTRYGRVYKCRYSQIIICHNNCIIMHFFHYVTEEEDYEHINRTILDVNVMNISLVIM